jgi:glycosyltransferase involved in cell wall biosynthesis
MMIQAFLAVAKENKQAKLLLVGDGPAKKDIEALLAEQPSNSDSIKIIPWSDNVPGLMTSADAYVLSSNYEGWGRVLIEALASNLPIVTTDVGCAGEVVLNNTHGLVVPVDDQQALVSAMLKLSQNQDFYNSCLDNIKSMDKDKIPGVNLDNYGQAWAKALLS